MLSAAFLIVAGFLLLNGCSAVVSKQPSENENVASTEKVDSRSVISASKPQKNNDAERLATLWQKRRQETGTGDYPVGPGDVLEIYVPGMEELKQASVRVGGEGTIA